MKTYSQQVHWIYRCKGNKNVEKKNYFKNYS